MPGLVIGGKIVQVEGIVDIQNFKEVPELSLTPADMRPRRTRWVRSIVLHNTKNIKTIVRSGKGPYIKLGLRLARYWSLDKKHAGAQLAVDWNAGVDCFADLLYSAAYHAGSMNDVSIGIEIYEDVHGIVYSGQLDTVVELVIWLCKYFGIQMQMPHPDMLSVIPRIRGGGKDCVGVFGHCHQYAAKMNDPYSHIFHELLARGFKTFDFINGDDLEYWKPIQRNLALLDVDGVPGPSTCDALRDVGFAHGLYDWKSEIQADR